MSNRRYQALTLAVIAGLGLLPSCATSKGEMAWVRIDGQRIAEDQTLLKQGQADVALCHADLDAGTVGGRARECMNSEGLCSCNQGASRRDASKICRHCCSTRDGAAAGAPIAPVVSRSS